MTQQTNGMPDLKYSEETFRDMYEALKRLFKVLPKECGGCIRTEQAMLEALEAIAKAEGVENG